MNLIILLFVYLSILKIDQNPPSDKNYLGFKGFSNAGKLAELEELARKNRVAERLAALKAGKS